MTRLFCQTTHLHVDDGRIAKLDEGDHTDATIALSVLTYGSRQHGSCRRHRIG